MDELERLFREWLALDDAARHGEVPRDMADKAKANYEFAFAESKRLAA